MKEFVEKLIGRLEELKTFKLNLADAMSELMKKDRLDNYISREETVEIVNQLAEEYKPQLNDNDLMIVESLSSLYPMKEFEEEALKRVIGCAEKYNNGWIACSERLPSKEEYQKCNGLFVVTDGNRTYATYFDIYDTLKFGEPTIERFRIDKCVIAWKPLPEPY